MVFGGENNNNKWRKSMCMVFATHGIHPWFFCNPWYLKNKTNNNEIMKIHDSYEAPRKYYIYTGLSFVKEDIHS
jgi:hypothetical protein